MEIDVASFGRAALFLGIPFVLMVFVFQWMWARTCDNYIEVLVAQKGGGGKYVLARKEGGDVTIKDPETQEVRTWPINELATIDITYPGVGFVPRFLQKTIRLAIVNEGDWEPMLNRSPHRQKIASPDVVAFVLKMKEKSDEATKIEIDAFLGGISTGSTREMIADPAVLGNLKANAVLKALASVSNDFLDTLKSINARLLKVAGVNPVVVYIGLGLIVILSAFTVYQIMQLATGFGPATIEKIDAIHKALGIK